jgi:phosphoribosylaminoimidazolecarboxamide formyltransferase/IMP cyclohydrolase
VIHGGLLANRQEPGHMEELKQHGIEPIDLVVSNLYPFEDVRGLSHHLCCCHVRHFLQTIKKTQKFEECIEMIDIGGPTMVRAAAKNCDSVTVVTSPDQYQQLVDELTANKGRFCLDFLRFFSAI